MQMRSVLCQVFLGLAIFPVSVRAQAEWWTLTDMTPAELRAIHEDRVASGARLRQAVAEGREAPLKDEADFDRVKMFYIGRETPELVPLWRAFDGFAALFRMDPRSYERAKPTLVQRGMSENGADVVVQYGVYLTDWIQQEIEAGRPDVERWLQALRQAQKVMGTEAYDRAVENRQAALLGGYDGLSPEESEELMAKWLSRPVKDMKLARIQDLREQVSVEDWQIFRRFLFEEVAPITRLRVFEESK